MINSHHNHLPVNPAHVFHVQCVVYWKLYNIIIIEQTVNLLFIFISKFIGFLVVVFVLVFYL